MWDEAYKFIAPVKWEIVVYAPQGISNWEFINDHLEGDHLYIAYKW